MPRIGLVYVSFSESNTGASQSNFYAIRAFIVHLALAFLVVLNCGRTWLSAWDGDKIEAMENHLQNLVFPFVRENYWMCGEF